MADDDIAGDQGTAIADTPMADSQPADTGTAPADTHDSGGSSTTVQSDQTQTEVSSHDQAAQRQVPWDSDENPYRKRFNDVLAHSQRLYQERQELQKRYDGLDPDAARKAIQFQQERQAAAALKPWNKGHEGFDKFQAVRSRVADFNRMRAAADTPEKQAVLRDLAGTMFSQEDLTLVREAEEDAKAFNFKMQSDPQGTIAEMVMPIIEQKLTQFDQFMGARQQTQQWFSDPSNQPLLDRYAPDMYRMMDPSVPARDKAVEVARLKAENDALKAKLSGQVETLATAEAQTSARRGQAATATRRGPALAPAITDPVQHLLKQGFRPGTTEFGIALQKLNASQG
jgi:hypothetical protein